MLPAWGMLHAEAVPGLRAVAGSFPAVFKVPAWSEPCGNRLLLRSYNHWLEQEWTRQAVPLVCALLVCWYLLFAHSASSVPSFKSISLAAFRYLVRHVQLLLRWALVLHRS